MTDAGVLVVGASGILAPAAAKLVAADGGAPVTGVGRVRPMPSGVEAIAVDARDAEALRWALGARRWGCAVVYAPAVTDASLPVLRAAVDGPVVLVRTSAAAAPSPEEPDAPAPEPGPWTLQLGWAPGVGGARWHTPEEISDAALAVLRDGAGRTLGAVRPWADRP
jgi:saccharopine dehydrogenase-like NADP-dependent oxidoreductase